MLVHVNTHAAHAIHVIFSQEAQQIFLEIFASLFFASLLKLITCSQNRQSTKFQNHENINFVEKLYFFILYNQVYIAKHDVKSLHSGFIFRENTRHYKVGG